MATSLRCPACGAEEKDEDGLCPVCRADRTAVIWRETSPAYLGIRFAASLIDHLAALALGEATLNVLFAALGGAHSAEFIIAVRVVVFLTYFAVFVTLFGTTPGKVAFRLSVRNRRSGEKPGVLSSIAREVLGRALCMFLSPLGYVTALAIPRARTVADLVSGTVVVRRRKARK